MVRCRPQQPASGAVASPEPWRHHGLWLTPSLAGRLRCAGRAVRQSPTGAYYVAAPELRDGDAPRGVVLFLHGAGRSGEEVVSDPDLAAPILARGYVLLAPSGLPRDGREGRFWSLGSRPPVRDEAAFLDQVLADAAPRFHLDRGRVLVAGFSLGRGWSGSSPATSLMPSPPMRRSRAPSGAASRRPALARCACC